MIIFVLASAVAASAQEAISALDKVWFERTGNTANAKEALALAEKAPNPDFELAWRAARACFWICDRTEDMATDKAFGQKGVEWAEKAVALNPGRVEGHYYLCLCLGEYGKGMSVVNALAKGLGGKFEKSGATAIKIDGAYEHAGAYRAMGRYYYTIPWPK